MNTANQDTYATIDLGSNSFHMIVARYDNQKVVIIDKLREMVRLAGGLDKHGVLSDAAMQTGIDCLEKFGQRLNEIPSSRVRVVGTNTLRKARNGKEFLIKAQTAIGHPIDIISGREEARLIYVGVANTIFNDEQKRLVIDIGGGSSELIIGHGYEPILTESLYMGCVTTTQQFFSDGEINSKKMRKAILFARQELEAVELLYKLESWELAYGTSGTVRAIHDVIDEKGWSDNGITLNALKKLKDQLIEIGSIDQISLTGLNNRRAPVFVGGVAILIGCFEALEIDCLNVCPGALREGLLYDLLDRDEENDVRNQTVNSLATQYWLDTKHTERIRTTANTIFQHVKDDWKLNHTDQRVLSWSCDLHTVGLRIAHSQYHKHGAYLIANSDMAGFSNQEQLRVANLIRFHRRKLILDEIHNHTASDNDSQLYLCIILRLAVLLHRSRSQDPLPEFNVIAENGTVSLQFPAEWMANHPLTVADLETESNYLQQIKIQLKF